MLKNQNCKKISIKNTYYNISMKMKITQNDSDVFLFKWIYVVVRFNFAE